MVDGRKFGEFGKQTMFCQTKTLPSCMQFINTMC